MTNFDPRQDFCLRFQPNSRSQKKRQHSSISKEQGISVPEQETIGTEAAGAEMQGTAASGVDLEAKASFAIGVSSVPADSPSCTLANSTNQARIEAFSNAVKEIFGNVLDSRFYGNVTFHFTVQGGIIQTIRSGVERSIR